jgi:hypothetical protein
MMMMMMMKKKMMLLMKKKKKMLLMKKKKKKKMLLMKKKKNEAICVMYVEIGLWMSTITVGLLYFRRRRRRRKLCVLCMLKLGLDVDDYCRITIFTGSILLPIITTVVFRVLALVHSPLHPSYVVGTHT